MDGQREILESGRGGVGGPVGGAAASPRICPFCKTAVLKGAQFCGNCGSPQIAQAGASGEAPSALLPFRYEIEGFLGHGSMGRVFLCRDRDLDVKVAVKVLRGGLMTSSDAVERLRQEARAAARFRGHAHILSIYTFDRYRDTGYLVMEYAAGGSLRSRLKREKRLPERECRRLGAEVAKALGFAHRRDVVHRDIKPGNILLDKNSRAKIGDFGISRVLAESVTSTTSQDVVGTPSYVPPELLVGEPADGRADLYSLGCMLYEMATGELPFKGSFPEMAMAKIQPDSGPPDLQRVRPDLSPGFVDVIGRLLRRNPEERFDSADACATALDAGTARSIGLTTSVGTVDAESKDAVLAQALFDKGVEAQKAGHFDLAERQLRRALSLHRKLFGPADPVVARDLQYVARNHYLQGDHKAAEKPFGAALRIRSRALGAHHPEIAHDLMFLARIYSLQGKHKHARAAYRRRSRSSRGRSAPSTSSSSACCATSPSPT